jgi:[acyl-carrier-protein] S-malonyltransferase
MPSKIVFLFPGQGSQAVGMGRDLVEKFPIARQTFEEADAALGFSLSKLCFEGPEEQLRLTEFTQPAIFTVSTAASRVLAEHGVQPGFVAGHSLGEYSAHVAAGTLAFSDGVRAVHNRGKFMQEAVPAGEGAMAAILALAAEEVAKVCAEVSAETGKPVSPANLNSPDQTVISGAIQAVEKSIDLCKTRGARKAVLLPVSAPFHCALMQPAQDRLAELLQGIAFTDPSLPVVVNVDAALVSKAAESRDALIRQVTGAVRWVECAQLLVAQQPAQFIEVGPGKVLCGLMRQIDRQQKCLNVEDSSSLEKTLAALQAQ